MLYEAGVARWAKAADGAHEVSGLPRDLGRRRDGTQLRGGSAQLAERLIQVRHQIVCVLQADGEAEHAAGDAGGGEFLV